MTQRTYTNWGQLPLLFGLDVACSVLDMTEPTVKTYIKEGKLPGKQLGRTWVFEKVAFMQAVGAASASDDARFAQLEAQMDAYERIFTKLKNVIEGVSAESDKEQHRMENDNAYD